MAHRASLVNRVKGGVSKSVHGLYLAKTGPTSLKSRPALLLTSDVDNGLGQGVVGFNGLGIGLEGPLCGNKINKLLR